MFNGPLTPLKKGREEHGFSKKSWSKMLESGIVQPAVRLAGEKKYWLDEVQLRRLEQIARTRDRLGKKYTLGSAAFELAEAGFSNVPVDLIKEYVRRKVEVGQGWMRRGCQRYVGLDFKPGRLNDESIEHASIKIAKKLTSSAPRKSKTFQFLLVYTTIILNLLYRPDEDRDYAASLEELIKPYLQFYVPGRGKLGMSDRTVRGSAEKLAGMLVDIRSSLRLDENNIVFSRLTDIPDDDFWKIFSVWPKVCRIFWDAHRALRHLLPFPDPSPDEKREFEILLLATLVANYDSKKPTAVYRQLLRGSTVTAGHVFDKIVDAVTKIARVQQLVGALLHK